MPFVYYLQINKSISGFSVAWASWHQGGQYHGFVNKKQMAFLQSFVLHSQQLLFLFSKHMDTMLIRRIVSPVKQIFVLNS